MSGTNPLSHAGTQNTTGRFLFWTIFPMNNEKVMGLNTRKQIECMSTRNVELSVKFSTMECQPNMENKSWSSVQLGFSWWFQNTNNRSLFIWLHCFCTCVFLEQDQSIESNSCGCQQQKMRINQLSQHRVRKCLTAEARGPVRGWCEEQYINVTTNLHSLPAWEDWYTPSETRYEPTACVCFEGKL